MKGVQLLALVVSAVSVASAALVGCLQTKSEVEVKPVDINLNITGRLELVITDARREEEKIAGAKAKRTVRPEDIGLPAIPAHDLCILATMVADSSVSVSSVDFRLLQRLSRFDMTGGLVESRPISS